MGDIFRELLILLALLVANGLFAMSEIAVVSVSKARLQHRAEQGDAKAGAALELAQSPNLFLSTVQIGITLVGILTGAYSGVTIAEHVAALLRGVPLVGRHAETLGLGLVVLGVTYVSLIGELVPKRLALHNPERIASAVARPMRALSVVAAPAVHLLSLSTDLILRLLGVRAQRESPVTEGEIRVLIDQGTRAGLFEEAEQDMVERVFRLGDRRVNALMTPRTEITWLDLDDEPAEILRQLAEAPYSRYPVGHESLDEVVGIVQVKDLLTQVLEGRPLDLKAALRHPLYVPETMRALKLMELFKQSGNHVALVVDEFNGVQGLVTFNDVLEAIVGDIPSPEDEESPQVAEREDGSWLVDGMLPVDEFKDHFDLDELPGEERGDYQTLGGFVMMHIGRIPAAADHFVWDGLRFEVVDMDGNRVDKVLVSRAEEPQEPPEGDSAT
jgi:putative hemolysin